MNKSNVIKDYNVLGLVNDGNGNTDSRNKGDYNSGNRNMGSCNSGSGNRGHRNSGGSNMGDFNSGDCNCGERNSGHYNTGFGNSGNFNRGDWNSGDWNATDYSAGCFCTEKTKILMFNKPSDWTFSDWLKSKAHELLRHMPIDSVEFVAENLMTVSEKVNFPEYKVTGGYLKQHNRTISRQLWWDNLSDESKDVIKALPNFAPGIFERITGVKVDED